MSSPPRFYSPHRVTITYLLVISLTLLSPPTSPLFPYTTLFRSIQRIIAVFPPPEQKQIRLQLAATLKAVVSRSEEHTSELQSHVNLVCRLMLEKKKITPGDQTALRFARGRLLERRDCLQIYMNV